MKRVFQFPWRSRRDIRSDVDEELAFHIETRTETFIAAGLDRDAARSRALHDFGDVADARRYLNSLDQKIESNRRRQDFMRDLMQDVIYAVRQLRRTPAFTLTAMLTLAVGIGANAAVINIANAVLFKPPHVRNANELAWVTPVQKNERFGMWTLPDFVIYRDASKSWSALATTGGVSLALDGAETLLLQGQAVSANYFDVLGVRPAIGRTFLPYEDTVGSGAMSVVISHALWKRRFASDSSVVDSVVRLNQQAVKIIGIAPESFNGLRIGEECEFWVPFATLPKLDRRHRELYTETGTRWLRVIGRLATTSNFDAAQHEAVALATRLETYVVEPEHHRSLAVNAVRGGADPGMRSRAAPIISLIMLVPLLVLGVACANVANLFVSRNLQRRRELAVRAALGASRARLMRQLLTECALLGVASGVLGVGVSYVLTAIIARTGQLPPEFLRVLAPDVRVFALTFVIAFAAGALFGLVPALAATGKSLTPALKNEGVSINTGGRRHRLRDVFVVSQVAMSLALLITAGLFVGSLRKALQVEPGFDPANTVSMYFDLHGLGYDSSRVTRFEADVRTKLKNIPGIEAVASASYLPLSGSATSTSVEPEGAVHENQAIVSMTASVSTGYFDALRIPIVQGRTFLDADREGAMHVAIVNERFAAILWPKGNPIGKRFKIRGDSNFTEIVGIARNGKYRRLSETTQDPYFWVPSAQHRLGEQGTIVVRGATSADVAARAVRTVLREVDPNLPNFGIERLTDAIAQTVDGQRAGAALLGVFGALALGLAAFGIFGVIAQGVASRTREIGIRMSLGAQTRDVVLTFVREGLGLTLIGGTIGVAMSLAASQILSSLLFGLRATDALTIAAASGMLMLVAALASILPARRAAKVDPLLALRGD